MRFYHLYLIDSMLNIVIMKNKKTNFLGGILRLLVVKRLAIPPYPPAREKPIRIRRPAFFI